MERTSTNSLNSKRNLKLPPIQGAVPAGIYGEKSWTSNQRNKSISHLNHHRSRIKKDILGATNCHSINRVDLNTRVDFPRHQAVISSPRQHAPVKLNLGHEFPKTYTVLPPINHKKPTVSHPRQPSFKHNERPSGVAIRRDETPTKEREIVPRPPSKSSAARTAAELSAKRRERIKDKLKTAEAKENISSAEEIKKLDETITSTENSQRVKTDQKDQEKDIVPRKLSPTYLGHLKCKRFARRSGVCIENEPTLINVTDQLKEIFLRRNMEEMYLI